MSSSHESRAPVVSMISRAVVRSSSVSPGAPRREVKVSRWWALPFSRAVSTSSVRLPSRMSSPAGFPVTLGSPKTPRRSSRSWKALPTREP